MNATTNNFPAQRRIARYFVIALLLHVALLALVGRRAFEAFQPKIVASFDAAPLPPPRAEKEPDAPNAAYGDFEYKGPTLGGGGGTSGKGPGGVPTAGGGTPESYEAHILLPTASANQGNVAEVIGVTSDAATAIARPSGDPISMGLTVMGGWGDTPVGTAGIKGPGGILGARMGPQRTVNLSQYHGSDETEKAVIAALRWLKANQANDGSWEAGSGTDTGTKVVTGTALATLAFLGHGETPDSAEFGMAVQKGLQFLIAHVDKDGFVFGGNLYAEALATIALSEGYAMTQSPALREPLDRMIAAIVRAQGVVKKDPRFSGGWRSSPSSDDADTLVTGWIILGLKSAKASGLDIPQETLAKAAQFLWNMFDTKNPGFGFQTSERSPSMTAVGVLCQQFLGNGHDPRLKGALDYLRQQKVEWNKTQGDYVLYGWYYITQAMFQGGGSYWEYWNREIRGTMVKNQQDDGRWMPPPNSTVETRELAATPAYSTALGALILEVYYRYTPIDELSQQPGGSTSAATTSTSTPQPATE